MVFTTSSLIATVSCIMMSPHFPEREADTGGEDDVFDQHDDFGSDWELGGNSSSTF